MSWEHINNKRKAESAAKKTGTTNTKQTNTVQKQVKKTAKKTGQVFLIALILALIIGIAAGAGVCYVLAKDDCFVYNGAKTVTVAAGEIKASDYKDFKIVSFGRDITDKATVRIIDKDQKPHDSVIAKDEEVYNVEITVKDFKYGNSRIVIKIIVDNGGAA